MAKEERIYYSDANGIRIGATNAVFGQYKYATRNIEAVSMAEESIVRWPAYAVMAVGVGFLVYGFFNPGLWYLVGVAGIASGMLNLARKKRNYAVRIVTPKGPTLVVGSKDKAYVRTVIDALHRAINAAREPAAVAPGAVSPGGASPPDAG